VGFAYFVFDDVEELVTDVEHVVQDAEIDLAVTGTLVGEGLIVRVLIRGILILGVLIADAVFRGLLGWGRLVRRL